MTSPLPTQPMNIQFVTALLSMSALAACSSTSQSIAQRETLEQKAKNKYAAYDVNSQQPAPPAEGPEDTTGPNDVNRNPLLVPSPLLRENAAGHTP